MALIFSSVAFPSLFFRGFFFRNSRWWGIRQNDTHNLCYERLSITGQKITHIFLLDSGRFIYGRSISNEHFLSDNIQSNPNPNTNHKPNANTNHNPNPTMRCTFHKTNRPVTHNAKRILRNVLSLLETCISEYITGASNKFQLQLPARTWCPNRIWLRIVAILRVPNALCIYASLVVMII